MTIPYLSLDISCIFTSPALLPVFKGSTLRGAFGQSLKKVICALRKQECKTCLLASSCAYSFIFATEHLPAGRIAARPHPYVLNPPAEEKRAYARGDSFAFNLVLLGRATEFLPHIVYTVEEMGKIGLGKGSTAGAGRFLLRSVSSEGMPLFSDTDNILHRPEKLSELTLEKKFSGQAAKMSIDLRSPLRIKYANELQKEISFPLLVRAALRRISALETYYGGGEPDLDFSGLCLRAELVATESNNVSWRDYTRYSNRQQQSMLMGGMMGKVQFTGPLDEFVPLFIYSAQVNLGKQTAFGLGRIGVEIS